MATIGVQPQAQAHVQYHQQRQQQPQQYQMEHVYPNHSVMEDSDEGDEEDSMEGAIDMDQAQYYQQRHQQQQQQQQGTYYQYTQPQHDSQDAGPSSRLAQHGLITHGDMQEGLDEEEYSDDDDDESTASIPDENIDFSLTYAL
jgi:hypothetical protein